MGLDKTGFTLLENELTERERMIKEAYEVKKAKAVDLQVQNLMSNGKQRQRDIKNIENNYDSINFKKNVEEPIQRQNQIIFQDWGGSRDTAFKTMSDYEKELKESLKSEPNEQQSVQETEADFKERMLQRFNENGKDKNRGRD